MDGSTQLRVARPTNRLAAIVAMYRDGLGLEVIGAFDDHDGFDGVMLGSPGAAYHFEFTHHRGHVVPDAPTQDHLVVFYVLDSAEWEQRCERMVAAGFRQVASYNPYWDRAGRTFEDLDGYRVVIQRGAW
ncbi:MAG: VOC family protein [Planctomycetota bacterium]